MMCGVGFAEKADSSNTIKSVIWGINFVESGKSVAISNKDAVKNNYQKVINGKTVDLVCSKTSQVFLSLKDPWLSVDSSCIKAQPLVPPTIIGPICMKVVYDEIVNPAIVALHPSSKGCSEE